MTTEPLVELGRVYQKLNRITDHKIAPCDRRIRVGHGDIDGEGRQVFLRYPALAYRRRPQGRPSLGLATDQNLGTEMGTLRVHPLLRSQPAQIGATRRD